MYLVQIGFFYFIFVFFFFKQKTAYEMRISDWSSDVCSSDLRLAHLGEQVAQVEALQVELRRPLAGELQSLGAEVQGTVDRADQGGRHGAHRRIAALAEAVGDQAGGRQDVAQVVVDLCHRRAQRREACLLQQIGRAHV